MTISRENVAQCADNYFHPRYRRRRRRHHHCRRHRHRRAAVTGADDERLNIPAGFCDACDLVVTKRQTDPRGKKTEKNIYTYLPSPKYFGVNTPKRVGATFSSFVVRHPSTSTLRLPCSLTTVATNVLPHLTAITSVCHGLVAKQTWKRQRN